VRIQSGSARGRKLKSLPKEHIVRPILARIRKSLFDILRPRIADAVFLDLYAGVGTVGLEALSNGARRAVFVDADRQSLRTIQHNIEQMGFASKAETHAADVTKSLQFLSGQVFDLVFMGPPYKDEEKTPLAFTVPTLRRLEEAGLVNAQTIVVGQHHKKEPLDLPATWEKYRQKEYGESILSFFRWKGK